jgi:predicted DNA-binding transcriptional regulator AlpA
MTSIDPAAFTPPLREVELVPFDDLVGRQEIAERQGVTVSAIDTWRRRYKTFPEPVTTLSGTPIWRWSDVARWIRSTPRKSGRPKKLVRA